MFYHQVLYNTLSKAEKYLIGLYCINWKEARIVHFHSSSFNYLAEFQGSGNSYFDKTVPFFPALSFEFSNPWYNNPDLRDKASQDQRKWGELEMRVEHLAQPLATLELQSVELSSKVFGPQRHESLYYATPFQQCLNLNLYDCLATLLFKDILAQHDRDPSLGIINIPFSIYIKIKCNEELFTYIKHLRCQVLLAQQSFTSLSFQS